MSLDEMQQEVMRDSETWFPTVAHDIPFLGLSLCGEAGELANKIKKMLRTGQDPQTIANRHIIADELTDVFIYTLNMAEAIGIELEDWYNKKREKNMQRFEPGFSPIVSREDIAREAGAPWLPPTVDESGDLTGANYD